MGTKTKLINESDKSFEQTDIERNTKLRALKVDRLELLFHGEERLVTSSEIVSENQAILAQYEAEFGTIKKPCAEPICLVGAKFIVGATVPESLVIHLEEKR